MLETVGLAILFLVSFFAVATAANYGASRVVIQEMTKLRTATQISAAIVKFRAKELTSPNGEIYAIIYIWRVFPFAVKVG